MNQRALLIGATGLVGGNLLHQLLADDFFSQIKIFSRRPCGIVHDKLEEILIDFRNIEAIRHQVTGDVLFSCLGTTLRQAGSKKAQYEVDYTYQYQFAKLASENQVPSFVLVSSTSASPNSIFFYSRMKGELEEDVKKLDFKKIIILQPSVLAGAREQKRIGEEIGAKLINALAGIFPFLRKYRSISGSMVARAAIHFLKRESPTRTSVFKLDELLIN